MALPRHRLIHARERLGLKRIDFARRVGVSRSYVTYIEDGRRDPSYLIMQRWLDALGPGMTSEVFSQKVPEAWPSTAELLLLSSKA